MVFAAGLVGSCTSRGALALGVTTAHVVMYEKRLTDVTRHDQPPPGPPCQPCRLMFREGFTTGESSYSSMPTEWDSSRIAGCRLSSPDAPGSWPVLALIRRLAAENVCRGMQSQAAQVPYPRGFVDQDPLRHRTRQRGSARWSACPCLWAYIRAF